MTQHLGTRAAIGWASTSDTLNERVHLLAVPLRAVMPGHSRSVYRAESLDRTVIESFTVGAGAHELTGEARFDDNPESLVELLRAGDANVTLNYYPDARDPLQVIPCKLVAPVGPLLDAAVDGQRGSFGNGSVALRLRRTDQKVFTTPYQGRDILWWYRGGGGLNDYTFSRADTATTYGVDGAIVHVVAGQARTVWSPDSGTTTTPAAGLPALLLEPAGTNLVLQSEDFSATWSQSGTPTRTGAAKSCGTVVLDLLGDDSGAAQEYYHQDIGFTGDAAKSVSFFYYPGPSAAAGGAAVVLRDTSAAADRLNAVITSTAAINRVPGVTCSAGSFVDAWRLKNGVWRIACLTSTVTAANTNNLRVIPANTAAQTGNVYVGGVQAEDSVTCSSYMPTTTTTNTRTADALTRTVSMEPYGVGGESLPSALTFYVRFVEAGTVSKASARIFQMSGASPALVVGSSGTYYQAALTNLTSGATATLAAAPTYGQIVELLVVLDASTGAVTISQSLDGATATTASAALSAGFMAATWGNTTFYLNAGPSGNQGWLWLLNGVAVRGGRSLAELRRIARV